ncbi:MAG TPA: DHA2 family efflux MFS transporter permease subunit [Streptosporangiaceae bacterium]|nr:DHA2 family efflux MFS transporter permease subunit [Streptosporangiaceae bacterium]
MATSDSRSNPPAGAAGAAPNASRQKWTVILASFASFMVGLDVLVVTTALPTLHEELDAGAAGLGWTINAYELGFAALILTGAALGDRFGRRLFFLTGLGIFTISSLFCALSPNIEALIAARAFQGMGGGIAIALALAVITDATPPEQRGAAFGIWGAVSGVAVSFGPIVGGAITQTLSWHWIFWLNVPVGAVVILLGFREIGESQGQARSFDILGLLLSTVGVFGIAQALIRGGEVGWTEGTVQFGFVGGVVALVLFLLWERRTAEPMMPLGMFRNRSFTGGCLVSFVLAAILYGIGFVFAQYLQLALGNEPLGVGLRMLPWVALAIFISPMAGKIADKSGERPLLFIGLLLHGIAFLIIGLVATTTTSYLTLALPLLLAGVGVAIAFPTAASAVMRSVEPAVVGMAAGVSNTIRQVGAVFGVACAAAVFTSTGGYDSPQQFVDGFVPALMALTVVTFLGVLASLMIRHPESPIHPPVPAEAQPWTGRA